MDEYSAIVKLDIVHSAYVGLKEQRCTHIETKEMSVARIEIVLPVREIHLQRYTCLLYGVDRSYVGRKMTYLEISDRNRKL